MLINPYICYSLIYSFTHLYIHPIAHSDIHHSFVLYYVSIVYCFTRYFLNLFSFHLYCCILIPFVHCFTFSFLYPSVQFSGSSDVGYAQGMNDIMSRFFVVMESEADAYWMFCNYMDHFKGDFLESDMLRKISMLHVLPS